MAGDRGHGITGAATGQEHGSSHHLHIQRYSIDHAMGRRQHISWGVNGTATEVRITGRCAQGGDVRELASVR